jgi:hypothetical protein
MAACLRQEPYHVDDEASDDLARNTPDQFLAPIRLLAVVLHSHRRGSALSLPSTLRLMDRRLCSCRLKSPSASDGSDFQPTKSLCPLGCAIRTNYVTEAFGQTRPGGP